MKLQMKFQKILMLVSLILAAVCIFYSFAYFTGGLAALYNYVGHRKYKINCEDTYYFAQDFNGLMLGMSIAYLVVVVLLYLTKCSSRRNYYISNYVVSIVATAYVAVFAIVCIAMNATTLSMFLNEIDWEAYRKAYEVVDPVSGVKLMPYYSDSVATFALGFVLHALVLVDAVALCLNLLWKIKLMKGEKKLLAQGFEKEVA